MRSKIIKNSFLLAFLVTVLPSNLYAFHTITEVLNNNKLIICKDYDQVKTDQKVEVYKRKFSNSRRGRELEKTDEFTLPKLGQQITLHHNELHSTSKFLPIRHTEILGTATVVNTKIAGESRIVRQVPKNKQESVERKTEIITEQDEAKISKNCFVAVPDKEIKLKDVTSISF